MRSENFRRTPSASAPILGRLSPGAQLDVAQRQGRWLQASLEGWIWAASVQRTTREGYDLRVSEPGGENLRVVPNGVIVGRLSQGTLLEEVRRDADWVRVRRGGWIWAESLERVAAVAEEPREGVPSSDSQVASDSGVGLDRAVVAHDAPLARIPNGDVSGTLTEGTAVRVLARSGEWVRVQTEGWVREEDLSTAAGAVLEGVSGAEVRARPEEFEGRLLQWNLQFLAVQEADELRVEIPQGRQYMLARGPLPEAGFVYVVLPPDRVEEVRKLGPIAEVVVIGRLRVARSRYLGNPVLDLVDLAVRQP